MKYVFVLQEMSIFTSGPGIVYTVPGNVFLSVGTPFYNFTSFTFTNMGATGSNGPSSITYGSTTPGFETPYVLTLSGGIQRWIVPFTGIYRIIACGGGGGGNTALSNSGRGVCVSTIITLNQGDIIHILCGHRGVNGTNAYGCAGGGGTYVIRAVNTPTPTPILIAGGGGGCWVSNSALSDAVLTTTASAGASGIAGTNGGGGATPNGANSYSGGAGFTGNSGNLANGTSLIASSFTNGGRGGGNTPNGGFGGGGSLHGGGGGYSGGGGLNFGAFGAAGGGGSYDVNGINNNATLYTGTLPAGVSGQVSSGYTFGNGFVVINAL
jgi:hypothetical protein